MDKRKKLIALTFLILIVILIVILSIYFYLNSVKHIGTWYYELKVYNHNNELIRDELVDIEFKDDSTFVYNLTNKIDENYNMLLTGTYIREKNVISMAFEDNYRINDKFYLKNDKLYFYEDNNNKYLTKGKVNVLDVPEIYNEIAYGDYLNLLKNKEKNIVIVGNDSCPHCVDYKNITLTDIYLKYNVKIYHLDSADSWDKLNLSVTPTTFFVENGEVIETIFGYVDYNTLNDSLKQFNYWQ